MSKKGTILEFQKIAKSKGGECLSKKYFNAHVKLKFKCKEGHIWHAKPVKIKHGHLGAGTWCPFCAGHMPLNINLMNEIAKSKNGKCLSKKYINQSTKLKWQCSKGHIWKAVPTSVYNHNSWCRICAGHKKKTIEDMQEMAAARYGKCLSKKYVSAHKDLKWECIEGHTWKARPNNIRIGTWCPTCKIFHKESLCRTTFEQIFNKPFKKFRPKWLRNKANNIMELDGYNKDLKLGFEYNGEQHYRSTSLYSKSKKELKLRRINDKLKVLLCEKKGINLIVINYKQNIIKLPSLIKKECKKFDLNTKNIDFEKNIDFSKIYSHRSKIENMKKIAIDRGGLCLSDKFIDTRTHLKWQCAKGHVWQAIPDTIINKETWCPRCNNRKDNF